MILEAGIIGQLVGLAGGIGSAVVGFFTAKENNRHHEEMAKMGHEHRVKEYDQSAGDKEHERTVEHDKILHGFRGYVRPIITLSSYAIASVIAILLVGAIIDPISQELYQREALAYLFGTSNMAVGWQFGPRLTQKAMELFKVGNNV